MINQSIRSITNIWGGKNSRTARVKKNILFSFFLKGFNIVLNFLLIPLTIDYLDSTQFGIWLTITSILSWFSFFDIGLGNGLRNKLAETNALGDKSRTRTYVSTTYATLGIISLILFIGFYIVNNFIPWGGILNVSNFETHELSLVVLVAFFFFCVRLVLQVINVVLVSQHSSASVDMINVSGLFFSVIIIYILKEITEGSLIKLVWILAGIPVLILLISSVWLYKTNYKNYAPNPKFVDFSYAKDLSKVGILFFIIQIGALIYYQTSNIIITQLFGPNEVTIFNVCFKLFSVITMIFNIINTPLWSAYTDAYTRKDFTWIQETLNRMNKVVLFLGVLAAIILYFSDFIYKAWLGRGFSDIPLILSFTMALSVIVMCLMNIYAFFINGTGKLKLQMILNIVGGLINIPLGIFLCKQLGIVGIVLANTIIFSIVGVALYFQSKSILKKIST